MNVEIITIGDELLIGQVVDTNSAWMAAKLNEVGLPVVQITSISDTKTAIFSALEAALAKAQVVLITGGLGPTKDDVTKQSLAEFFNMSMRLDQDTLLHVEQFFKQRNRPMIAANIKQAEVPDACTVITNKNGTAPCMWFERDKQIVVAMPGVPFEMMYLMEEEIISRLQKQFNLTQLAHYHLLTTGIGESFLAEKLADIEAQLPPHINLAYLPKLGQVRLRLSAKTGIGAAAQKDLEHYGQLIVERIAQYVVHIGNEPLEKVVLNIMQEHALSLATAESCTGGYLAHLITQHAGASQVYQGGVVSYSNNLKQQLLGVKDSTLTKFGAVSQETACEMAQGAVRELKTDYAIAVTGIAGPGGATPDKPVGTVWIALASKKMVKAKCFHFPHKRLQNIERSATEALSMLLLQLKQDLNVKH